MPTLRCPNCGRDTGIEADDDNSSALCDVCMEAERDTEHSVYPVAFVGYVVPILTCIYENFSSHRDAQFIYRLHNADLGYEQITVYASWEPTENAYRGHWTAHIGTISKFVDENGTAHETTKTYAERHRDRFVLYKPKDTKTFTLGDREWIGHGIPSWDLIHNFKGMRSALTYVADVIGYEALYPDMGRWPLRDRFSITRHILPQEKL